MPRALSYREVILAHRPFCYLRLGEAGGLFRDETGAHNGTLNGSDFTYAAAGALANDPNTSALFTGANSTNTWIELNGTSAFSGTLTAETWIYPTVAQFGQIFDQDLSGNDNWRFRLDSGGTVTILVQGGSHQMVSTGACPLNQWTHLVITSTGSPGAGTNGIYFNGKLDTSGTVGAGPGVSHNIVLGFGTGVGEHLAARMDEVALYNYMLTPGQIAEHYRARVAPSSHRLATFQIVAPTLAPITYAFGSN